MKRHVFHGTHRSFVELIRESGLPAFSPEEADRGLELRRTEGVRVRLSFEEARRDAAAWTAYMVLERPKPMKPEGMIVAAWIDEDRIREDRHGVLRVERLTAQECELRGPVKFPEFGGVMIGNRRSASLADARAALLRSLDDFEELTNRSTRRGVMMPGENGRSSG